MFERKPLQPRSRPQADRGNAGKPRKPATPTVPGLSIDETFDDGRDPYNNTLPGVAPRYRKD